MISALIGPVTGLLDKFIPDADEKARIAHELATMGEKHAQELALAQIEVNKAEAASGSIFKGGWRPAVGWVCASAFAYHFVLQPILLFVVALTGTELPTLPEFDMSTLLPVLGGMLGIGGLRTYEKQKEANKMNIDKLREELKTDEGCRYEIYLDHLGLPTHGIGHLILSSDMEYGQAVGTPVSEDRVNECFAKDVETVLSESLQLYPNFQVLPEEVKLIIANMMFNMGRPRLSKFKGMKAAVDAGDWHRAAVEMVDSKWYQQVTNRADRLVQRMRAVK